MNGGEGPGNPEQVDQPSAKETARYITEHVEGLSKLARNANLDVVAYLLDMARLEAEEIVQGKLITKSD